MLRQLALATLIVSATSQAFAAGDPAAGEKVFNKCKVCHMVGENAKTRIGPELNGIVGRKAASIEGFTYSEGLKELAAKGLVWSDDTLTAYLKNPRQFNAGTKMMFAGLPKDEDIADVIAYLNQFGPDGKKK